MSTSGGFVVTARGLSGLKCRCGTHMAILRAVKLAATRMAAARRA